MATLDDRQNRRLSCVAIHCTCCGGRACLRRSLAPLPQTVLLQMCPLQILLPPLFHIEGIHIRHAHKAQAALQQLDCLWLPTSAPAAVCLRVRTCVRTCVHSFACACMRVRECACVCRARGAARRDSTTAARVLSVCTCAEGGDEDLGLECAVSRGHMHMSRSHLHVRVPRPIAHLEIGQERGQICQDRRHVAHLQHAACM
jgi:hypothetical protein